MHVNSPAGDNFPHVYLIPLVNEPAAINVAFEWAITSVSAVALKNLYPARALDSWARSPLITRVRQLLNRGWLRMAISATSILRDDEHHLCDSLLVTWGNIRLVPSLPLFPPRVSRPVGVSKWVRAVAVLSLNISRRKPPSRHEKYNRTEKAAAKARQGCRASP